MRSTAYRGYVDRLSRTVDARLAEIEAVYNFDYGHEFEVGMCLVLESILPARYGVCRGFVVTEAGDTGGDDLIIYDKMNAPSLRPSRLQFATKEQIPAEAVFAYIECKHSIDRVETLEEAVTQVRRVKKLILTRSGLDNHDYEEYGPTYNGKVRPDWPRPYPRLRNQPYCAIFARRFSDVVRVDLVIDKHTPDLLVLGTEKIATQSAVLGPDGIKGALFIDDRSDAKVRIETIPASAYGLGILCLMQAIAWIKLDPIDWSSLVNDGFWNTRS